MPRSTKDLAVSGLLTVLTALLLFRVVPYFQIFNVQAGDSAPGFNLTADDGSGVSLDNYRGKYVLLNFWATWCPPCVEELPSLNALHSELRDQGLVVLGISVDEQEQLYRRFLERHGVVFPTSRDPLREVSQRYGTLKYPESYLIDRDGKVIRKYVGPEDWTNPEILNYLRSLL